MYTSKYDRVSQISMFATGFVRIVIIIIITTATPAEIMTVVIIVEFYSFLSC